MSELARLERSHLPEITALCSRSIAGWSPSSEELEGALFAPEQPAVVLGDPTTAVVATVATETGAHVRLLVVDPTARGRGHGRTLLEAAEAEVLGAGHRSLTTGADAPYYLWPGVPSTAVELICLFESRHYSRVETNFDMDVDLSAIPEDPGGHVLAQQHDRAEVDEWMAAHWPNWRLEVLRALEKGNLVLVRDAGPSSGAESGTIEAFCAFEVNRRDQLGPVAVRPDLLGRGRGKPALLGALHELRRRGRGRIAVAWVGPVAPYAAVGGTVGDVYFVYRRELS